MKLMFPVAEVVISVKAVQYNKPERDVLVWPQGRVRY